MLKLTKKERAHERYPAPRHLGHHSEMSQASRVASELGPKAEVPGFDARETMSSEWIRTQRYEASLLTGDTQSLETYTIPVQTVE